MKLSPFLKKIEIEAGYRGFYRLGTYKFTVTVEDNGIGILIDQRTGHPLDRGVVVRLFKPMTNVWAGKKYAEAMGEPSLEELLRTNFIELGRVFA